MLLAACTFLSMASTGSSERAEASGEVPLTISNQSGAKICKLAMALGTSPPDASAASWLRYPMNPGTSMTLKVQPGRYTLRIDDCRHDYAPATLMVDARQPLTVRIEVRSSGRATAPQPGVAIASLDPLPAQPDSGGGRPRTPRMEWTVPAAVSGDVPLIVSNQSGVPICGFRAASGVSAPDARTTSWLRYPMDPGVSTTLKVRRGRYTLRIDDCRGQYGSATPAIDTRQPLTVRIEVRTSGRAAKSPRGVVIASLDPHRPRPSRPGPAGAPAHQPQPSTAGGEPDNSGGEQTSAEEETPEAPTNCDRGGGRYDTVGDAFGNCCPGYSAVWRGRDGERYYACEKN